MSRIVIHVVVLVSMAGVFVARCAAADILSPRPDAVTVTIYHDHATQTAEVADMHEPAYGIAMISEQRALDLPAGRSTVKFRGVAETIVPQSAKLESLSGHVIETNFDYQLLGPGELIANSIGDTVHVVRTNAKTGAVVDGQATLLSGPSGVVLSEGGQMEALGCSGAVERLVFDKIPASLTDKPTLSAVVNVVHAGRYNVRLSYLATGLDWSADYVASINSDNRTLDLAAWITLANKQSTAFADAPVQVIAGNISRDEDTRPISATSLPLQNVCWPVGKFYGIYTRARAPAERGFYDASPAMAPALKLSALQEIAVTGQKVATQRNLGDYKLYALPAPTTVAARQVKQVRMLDEHRIPFKRIYVYTFDLENSNLDKDHPIARPQTTIRIQNTKAGKLGKPLPAGTVAVMERGPSDGIVLAGEHAIEDTPKGLPVDLAIGEAMDVTIEPRIVGDHAIDFSAWEHGRADLEVTIANNKPIPITLEYLQSQVSGYIIRVANESQRHTLKHGMPLWTLHLRAGQQRVLRYTVDVTEVQD